MSRLRFLFVPLDAHLLADWHRVGIGDTLTSVLLGQAGDPSNHVFADRCPGIDLAHVRVGHKQIVGSLLQLIPADIGLHPLFPLVEERAVLRKGQALALLLLPHALRLALDPVLAGLADLGEDNTCHPVDEGIRLRLITTESEFVEGRFVDDLQLLQTSSLVVSAGGC